MKERRLEDRYQFQPWYVKLYRQVRYTPYAIVMAVWTYLTYPQKKLDENEMPRSLMARLVFKYHRRKLEHWVTLDEAFKDED